MTINRKVDVVTVGAGWTAAILAWKLTEAGLNVVSIEQGPGRWTTPGFQHNHDALRHSARYMLMQNLRRETWTWRPNRNAPSLPMRQYGTWHPGQGLGGSAVHWTAQLWRFLPSDFRYRSHHVERYGEEKLPEGSTVQDWPLSYDDLEPYYSEFEWDIGASGQAGNLNGEIIEGGNPFEGPRSLPYRNPPLQATIPSEMFAGACRELGYSPFPYPSGIASEAFTDQWGNNRAACLYCGFCTRYGCEVDAKASPINTHLPAAFKTGRYEVRGNSKVTRINTDGDGMATGVRYIDENGEEQQQDADIVLVTAFTLTNVRLLLLSTSNAHPDGIGNDNGMVGRNFTYQQFFSPFVGYFPGRRFNLYMGNGTTANAIYDFQADVFDHSDLDFIGGAVIWSTLGERLPVTGLGNFPIANVGATGDGRNWGAEWKSRLAERWNSFADIGYEAESLAYEDHFLDLDPRYRATDDGQPLLRFTFGWKENDRNLFQFMRARCMEILEAMGPEETSAPDELADFSAAEYGSTHPTGGAIMGSDPSNSVTNSYGQVWDTPNVFVTGAALYPQNPGANPTDTVGALAYRTGDAMRDQYLRRERQLME